MRVVDTFSSTHNYYIHDIKYDFYGERIASCSSDHHIKVWDKQTATDNSNPTPSTTPSVPSTPKNWKCSYDWKAHNGSIWKVEWAHPEFGQVLASCSYDHTVSIWEEPPANSTGPGSGVAPLMISQGIIGSSTTGGTSGNLTPGVSANVNANPTSSNVGSSTGNTGVTSLPHSASQGSLSSMGSSAPSSINGASSQPKVTSSSNLQVMEGDGNLSPGTPEPSNPPSGSVSGTNLQPPSTAVNTSNPSPAMSSRRAWLLKATLVDSTDDVVDIKFAPKHLGLKLATCSLSGKIRIYDAFDVMNLAYWTIGHDFDANSGGKTHCLSWCPYRFKEPMMVVGCEDGKLRIWAQNQTHRKWQAWAPTNIIIPASQNTAQIPGLSSPKGIQINDSNAAQMLPLFGHAQPVHDVAWAPNLGRSYDLIASASKDGTVRIWKISTDNKSVELMEADETHKHNAEVWKVEWNLSGTVLASSGDDGTVRLWKYSMEEKRWICESVVEGVNKSEY